ncbi:secretory phospholipase A2 receptor-like [Thalassophryne amazonica]|uniref:secretory phospholipase A2 receptor-like n=1 Tax=Thalassophryne amazonica TaxID=390379 RepID=UPI001471A80A|nr:secretory phospholipase A2 receptor-like [Thalassophryne amazonica]
MMEQILLGVLFLSGWSICPTRPLRQYHYIPQNMTWTEAQTYCRQNYTDLATIENTEEINQMNTNVSSAGSNSEVWIGLNSFISWQWSDGSTGSGAEYRSWDKSQTDFQNSSDYCVVSLFGNWICVSCVDSYPFICNKGTHPDPEFVLVQQPKNWTSAQTYCRENFFDLATVRNETENEKLIELSRISWIGLFTSLNTSWSDGSKSSFTNWDSAQDPLHLDGKWCVASSGTWRLKACETRLPFVCHGESSPPTPGQTDGGWSGRSQPEVERAS